MFSEWDRKFLNFTKWTDEIHTGKPLSNAEMIPQQVDWVPRKGVCTLLASACLKNRQDLARFLLEESKANVNAKDLDGWTALMLVAYTDVLLRGERLDVVEFLLRRGANPLLKTQECYMQIPAGADAIAIAMAAGHHECVELLAIKEAPPAPPAPPLSLNAAS